VDGRNAKLGEQAEELVLDDIGQCADDHQARRGRGICGQVRDQGGKAGVLALGEGRLDPAARIIENLGHAGMLDRQPGGRVDRTKVMDQLRQILDRINVMVRRR